MSNRNIFDLPKRFKGLEESVWEEYIELANKFNPVDLGQGFPDFAAPQHLTNALAEVANSKDILLHQYTRGCGHPRLINALSKLYSPLINKNINPNTEIIITSGAYGALYYSIISHIDEGDEVIIIEPFFDCYETMVRTAGGTAKFVPLRCKSESSSSSGDWFLDKNELENAFNNKTKAIILNTPNNPLGKVFTKDELITIADLCKKWDVICISDEVYEWFIYPQNEHIRIASLPDMWERTITIGSAGKTFSITGWKIGWAYGSSKLIRNLSLVFQNTIFTSSTPVQEAIAIGFEIELARFNQDDSYFKFLSKTLDAKKNFTLEFLQNAGFKPVNPGGGYFILADWTDLGSRVDLTGEMDKYNDYRFTKWLTKNIGIQAIPCSAFFSEPHKHLGEKFVRFCFIKKDEKLQKAADILENWTKINKL